MNNSLAELAKKIKDAASAYYNNEPIMTDDEFDALTDTYTEKTGEPLPVGWGMEGGDIKLPVRMGSLNKVHTLEDVDSFLDEAVRWGATSFNVSCKWDGMACVAKVVDGEVAFALTRGDGKTGKDVTRAASRIKSVVSDAANLQDGYLIFEVLLPKSNLSKVNDWYKNEYGDADHYDNVRNATPGLLMREKFNADDAAGFLDSRRHFDGVTVSKGDVFDEVNKIGEHRDYIDMQIDGVVIAVEDPGIRDRMGYHSSGNPRWGVAFKFPPRVASTTLRSVAWSTGRTGRITPVAQFDPVDLGTTVEFATVHNIDRVNELDLHIGDTIIVSKRGDVIPAVEKVIVHGSGEKVTMPADIDEVDPAVILTHSVKTLGVKNVSKAFFTRMFVEKPWDTVVDGLSSFMSLNEDEIAGWEGYSSRSAELVVSAREAVKKAGPEKWIGALNIPMVGVNTATNALRETGGVDELIVELDSDDPDLGADVGETKAGNLTTNRDAIIGIRDVMRELGINTSFHVGSDSEFAGKKIVITGSMPFGMSRGRVKDILVAAGAKPGSSISKSTDYLFAGEKAGSKLDAAEKAGVTIVTGVELEKVLTELQ